MPYSDQSNIQWTGWLLGELKPKTIIDVGPGAGKYGQIAKEILPECHTTAVEIWAPYIKQFNLEQIYDRVDVCDGRIYPYPKVDLIIFGDVLEHLSRTDALELWKRISKKTKYAMISIPVIHYPQGDVEGNPYEIHIEDHWTHEDILETFPGITGHQVFGITGSYIADFTQ
jgi:hypothetical protein